MAVLKPYHLELLRFIISRLGPVPLSEFDGRQLRPLKANGLVVEHGDSVVPTSAGRRLLAAEQSDTNGPASAAPGPLLSDSQEKLLRQLIRSPEPMLADHLDGRVLRALDSRGLVRIDCGWVYASPSGAAHFGQHIQKERILRNRRASATRGGARAEASCPRWNSWKPRSRGGLRSWSRECPHTAMTL